MAGVEMALHKSQQPRCQAARQLNQGEELCGEVVKRERRRRCHGHVRLSNHESK